MESIANLIIIPTAHEKPLSERDKRWILQREIFEMLEKEDMRMLNWKRYVAYLKKYKIEERKVGRQLCIKQWKKCANKEVSYVRKLSKSSFGFFTSHISSSDLFALKSRVSDSLNRGESPTCYVYSLSRVVK